MKLDMLGDLSVRFYAFVHHPVLTSVTGASMTLVGLLPPLCYKGSMLVDGGYSKCYPLGHISCDDVHVLH
jgi:predicted acylesterase/phospholipase RssA